MKKSSFKESLNEIHKLAERIPKTVNEAIHFTEEDENIPYDDAEPVENEPEMQSLDQERNMEGDNEPEMNQAGKELVDKIRKVSLQGMADLADDPNTPEYEILKKIWKICDSALVEKKEDKEGAIK